METIVVWFALSVLAGVVAGNKGRSSVGFFMLAVFFSPLVGLLGAWVARPASVIEKEKARSGKSRDYKQCPMCAETVKQAALKCRYCGADLTQSENDDQTGSECGQPVEKQPKLAREFMTLEEILASESNESSK